MKLNYTNVCQMMFGYGKLSPLERDVVEYLWTCDAYEGGYSDLTRDMGRPESHIPNIRKAVKNLQKMRLVYVCDIHDVKEFGGKKVMYIVDGWLDELARKEK